MFLIRSFFWVSLVILLLPIGDRNESNLIGATKYAMSDMGQFCGRNLDICNIGSEAWRSLKYKASYSLKVIAGVANEIKKNSAAQYSPQYQSRKVTLGKNNIKNSRKETLVSQNTLTSKDMSAGWSFKN